MDSDYVEIDGEQLLLAGVDVEALVQHGAERELTAVWATYRHRRALMNMLEGVDTEDSFDSEGGSSSAGAALQTIFDMQWAPDRHRHTLINSLMNTLRRNTLDGADTDDDSFDSEEPPSPGPALRTNFDTQLATLASVTPLQALTANRRLIELLTERRGAVMRDARNAGHSWTSIGAALSMSKQGAADWYVRHRPA